MPTINWYIRTSSVNVHNNLTINVCKVNRKCSCCSTAGWQKRQRTWEDQEVRQDPLLQSLTSFWSIPQLLAILLYEILSEEAGLCNALVIFIIKIWTTSWSSCDDKLCSTAQIWPQGAEIDERVLSKCALMRIAACSDLTTGSWETAISNVEQRP